jgi:hypothetical protein
MAVKTAESDALKRCAVNLGTQFGLSLYQNGATVDVVQRTLDIEEEATPHGVATSLKDAVAEAAPEHVVYEDPKVAPETPQEATQEASDAPEPSEEPETAPEAPQEAEKAADSPGAQEWIDRLSPLVKAKDVPGIITLKAEIAKARAGRLVFQGQTLSKWIDLAVIKAGK